MSLPQDPTDPTKPSRRRLLALLASTGLSALFTAPGFEPGHGAPRDQGIGGTGAAPPPTDESDRGIGGTGVIGTIKKFGSIYVNDLRISYPESAEVRIDGRPASLRDLKLGQVVRVDARGADDALSTTHIAVTHEVVGPVERRDAKRLVVLGQTVSMEELHADRAYEIGETVAVSGLRRNDGTIVASLIEPRPGAIGRVSGPVTRDRSGLRVGALPLDGVSPELIGHRATLVGRMQGDVFVVTHGESDAAPFPKSVRRLSIESYVERRDGELALGSGLAVAGGAALAGFSANRSVRAVLVTSVDREGRYTVDSLRSGGRTYNAPGGGRGPGGGGRGPGGGGRGGSGGGRGGEGRGEGGRGHEGGRGQGGQGGHGHEGGGRGQGGRGHDGGRGRDGGGGREGGRGQGGERGGGHGQGGHGEGRHGGGGHGGMDGGRGGPAGGGRRAGFEGGGRGPGGFGGHGPGGFGGGRFGGGRFGGPGGPGGGRFGGGPGFGGGGRGFGGGGFRGGGGGFRGGGGGFRGGGGGGFHGGGGRR